MDFLEKFEKLIPLLSHYPRWAQFFFICTLLFVLSSIFLFALLYSQASKQIVDAPADVKKMIEERQTSVTQDFGKLGAAFSAYYTSCVALQLDFRNYTTNRGGNVEEYISEKLPVNLQLDVDQVIVTQNAMKTALEKIQLDRFLKSCWDQAAMDTPANALIQLKDQMIQLGIPEREVAIDVKNISSLIQFFSVSSAHLRSSDFSTILTPTLMTNMADTSSVNKHYDNASMRSMIFSGNLLFGNIRQFDVNNDSTLIVASFGTAVLLDIYHSIPNQVTISKALIADFPEYRPYVESQKMEFSASSSVSDELRYAVNELDKNRDLILLKSLNSAARPSSMP